MIAGFLFSKYFSRWFFFFEIIFLAPCSIFVWRIYNFYLFKKLIKNSYLYDKNFLIDKIKKDLNSIMFNKGTELKDRFGSGKSYYMRLVTSYAKYRYGIWVFYHNFWWNPSKELKDLFGVDYSFQTYGINIPLNKTKIIYLFVIVLYIVDKIIYLLFLLIKYLFTFGQSKMMLLVIDEPERAGKDVEASLNKLFVGKIPYVVMNSMFFKHEDKIRDYSINIPNYEFGKANLRYVDVAMKKFGKEFDEFIIDKKYSFLENSLKQKMKMKYIGARAVEEENDYWKGFLDQKLSRYGKTLSDFMKQKNHFYDDSYMSEGYFIWKYNIEEISKLIKNEMSDAENTSLNSFLENKGMIGNLLPNNMKFDDEYFWSMLRDTISISYGEHVYQTQITKEYLEREQKKFISLSENWFKKDSVHKSIENIVTMYKIIATFWLTNINHNNPSFCSKELINDMKLKINKTLGSAVEIYGPNIDVIIRDKCDNWPVYLNKELRIFDESKIVNISLSHLIEGRYVLEDLSDVNINYVIQEVTSFKFMDQFDFVRRFMSKKYNISNLSDAEKLVIRKIATSIGFARPDDVIQLEFYKYIINLREELNNGNSIYESYVKSFKNFI